jgi:hypothetical protein
MMSSDIRRTPCGAAFGMFTRSSRSSRSSRRARKGKLAPCRYAEGPRDVIGLQRHSTGRLFGKLRAVAMVQCLRKRDQLGECCFPKNRCCRMSYCNQGMLQTLRVSSRPSRAVRMSSDLRDLRANIMRAITAYDSGRMSLRMSLAVRSPISRTQLSNSTAQSFAKRSKPYRVSPITHSKKKLTMNVLFVVRWWRESRSLHNV